jgi:DNA-binding transcriptional MerR regulator
LTAPGPLGYRDGMDQSYTIGGLAQAAGVPSSTIRFYERKGLLRPTGRTRGNYRRYDSAALDRLRFIKTAKATGFSLNDIAALLELSDGQEVSCDKVQTLILARLSEIRQHLKDLIHVEQVLSQALSECQASQVSKACAVIQHLADKSLNDDSKTA